MTTNTALLQAPAGVNQVVGLTGTVYLADAFGRVTVNAGDIQGLLNNGYTYAPLDCRYYTTIPPAAASATAIVSAVAITNVALTIAAQPDISRKLAVVWATSSAAITAGSLSMVYTDTNGQTVTDVIALAGAVSATTTQGTSHGVAHLTSATVAGLVGGTTPTIQIGTGTALGLPLPLGWNNLSVFKETKFNLTAVPGTGVDESVGTVDTVGGTIIPTTVPNATLSYTFGYSFTNGGQATGYGA